MEERCYEALLSELYDYVNRRYGDCPEREVLIQEAFVALIAKEKKDGPVDDPQAFLRTVLRFKHNDWLRRKYRDAVVTYDFPDLAAPEEDDDRSEEATAVRREVGRLLRIYREVTVRHYMHGHTVERIANELGVPKGTVLSRLSTARRQLKGRLESMKTYSEYSYEPKRLSLGIWGSPGLRGEPFTTAASLIEQNVLMIAYEKPLSVQVVADTMGIPCAYLEPIIDTLVREELLGKTSGGLVYTRCFIQQEKDRFGDMTAKEALAKRKAREVWTSVWKHIASLMAHESPAAMNQKQQVTLALFVLHQALDRVIMSFESPRVLPERPDGGRWLAIGTASKREEETPSMYAASGPYTQSGNASPRYIVFDYQTCFGDTHWRFHKLRYRCSHQEILRFLVSLYQPAVTVREPVVELVPDLERLHILRRDEDGEIRPDFPALTMTEYDTYWIPAIETIAQELGGILGEDLKTIRETFKRRVPTHVDHAEQFTHHGALQAYSIAQMLAVVNEGLLPYPVEVGKTPLIVAVYENET